MSGFSVEWLDLREPADRAARDSALAQQALADLKPGSVVVDLGAGSGSTLRALTETGANEIRWRLVDLDDVLLTEASRRHGATHAIETFLLDLKQPQRLPLQDAALVTASALFDLVSTAVVDQLIEHLRSRAIPLYAVLNYDGIMQWQPIHPLDESVRQQFNLDQKRDKGLGPALGPQAGSYLEHALREKHYDVHVRSTPWQLGPDDHALVTALIDGIAAAVSQQGELADDALTAWAEFRRRHVQDGQCTIGHVDLLAIPQENRS
ncbi:MAG TPA: hypothetical protein VM553_05760 [Dongiaceae bacterium]|nr:hypothetical protein [Dongiaceae bacterium]